MPTDCKRLQGEIDESPENQELNVEGMLAGFLRALLDEQKSEQKTDAAPLSHARVTPPLSLNPPRKEAV